MRSHAPCEPIVTKVCMWGRVGNMITDAKFYENRLRGFGVTGPPPQTPFPILNVHRPYDSVSTTVLHCDSNWCCIRNCLPIYLACLLYTSDAADE